MLAWAMLAAAPAHALDTGDIVIASLRGDVQVTMQGAARAVRAGSVLELPATVRTGRDGNVELRQGATSVSVGPDTLLEFPALETRGGPIDRIVQPRGNAFYSIGKRAGRKLRVEAPYLVGVVKGTQFSVAAADDTTTISLFEGLLEIRASDESSVVDIEAGQIATRRRGDAGIGVIRMDAGKAPPPSSPPAGARDARDPSVPRLTAGPSGLQEVGPAIRPTDVVAVDVSDLALDVGAATGAIAGTGTGPPSPGTGAAAVPDVALVVPDVAVQIAADTTVDVAPPGLDVNVVNNIDVGTDSLGVNAATQLDVGTSGLDAGVGAAVTAGPVDVDTSVNVGVDLAGAPAVDVGAAASLDVGGATAVDLGVGAGLDVGGGVAASVDVNAGVDAGPLSVDAGAGVAVDLGGNSGAASVDLGVDAGLQGVAAVDAGANVDVGAGATVAADVGANVAGVDAGVTAGVDLGAGAVDLGVDVAGTELDVGVDLGLGGDDKTTTPGNVVNDVVDTVDGLLGGLLRKPGKK